jgi:hypothetical protein
MALYFAIEAITGRSVSADGRTVTVDLNASVTDLVRLNMSPSIAAGLVDTLTSLNGEAKVKQIVQEMGAAAPEYPASEKVAVNLEPSGSVLLIDFDRGKPHHVGVAVSVEKCEALIATLMRAVEVARALRQSRAAVAAGIQGDAGRRGEARL